MNTVDKGRWDPERGPVVLERMYITLTHLTDFVPMSLPVPPNLVRPRIDSPVDSESKLDLDGRLLYPGHDNHRVKKYSSVFGSKNTRPLMTHQSYLLQIPGLLQVFKL